MSQAECRVAKCRVSLCTNYGRDKGSVTSIVVVARSFDEVVRVAANKLKLKKKDARTARLFFMRPSSGGLPAGTELFPDTIAGLLDDGSVLCVSKGEPFFLGGVRKVRGDTSMSAAAPSADGGCLRDESSPDDHAPGGVPHPPRWPWPAGRPGLVGTGDVRDEGDGGEQKTDQKREAVRVPSVLPSVLEQAAAAAEAVAESPPSSTVVAAGGRGSSGGGVSLSGRFPVLEGNVLPLLREAIAGCDSFVERDFGDYVSFDYKNATPVAFPDPWEPGRRRKARERWMLAARRECRGLLVSSSTGEVLARRFHKFFNVNETSETAEDRLNLTDLSGVTVAAKLDGSLSSPFLRHCDYAGGGGGSTDGGGADGRVVAWATRGAVSDSLTEYVRVSMVQDDECAGEGERKARGYDALARHWLGERRKTPLFEWCEAGTAMGVIHHQRSSLLLLAVRDNATGEYLPRAELEDTAIEFNVPLAGIVSLVPPTPTRGEQGKHDAEDDSGGNKRDLAWLVRSVNALDDQSEGVVLYLPDNQTMFKVKTGRDERRLEKPRVLSYSVGG